MATVSGTLRVFSIVSIILLHLGADAVWITPIYPSPMADFGYDVANYCDIDPLFGTLSGFDRLLAEVHRRGLRMILDFVPNHTSWSIPGLSRAGLRAAILNATGISGETSPTTGSATSVVLHGSMMQRPRSITCTLF